MMVDKMTDQPLSEWRRWLIRLGLLVVLAVFAGHVLYFVEYVNDDAYITYRYSRFLADGRGPYFNLGEHVEGYTNFLHMLLVAIAIRIGGEGIAASTGKAIGIAGGVGAVVLTFALTRFVGRRLGIERLEAGLIGVLAAGLLAVSPAFAVNSTSGLETQLFGACLTAGVLLGIVSAARGRWLGSGLAFAAAVLARPEGPVLFAAYWLAQAFLVRPRLDEALMDLKRDGLSVLGRHPRLTRHLAPDAIIVTAVFLAHLVFRRIAYDGEWLPNTYYAKAGGFQSEDATTYITRGVLMPFFGPLGVAIAAAGWARAYRRRAWLAPVLAVAVCGSLLPYLTGTDWMAGWRLLVPFLPLAATLVALGWFEALRWIPAARTWVTAALLLVLLPVLWFMQEAAREEFREHVTVRARGYAEGHEALARWLRNDMAEPGDMIALMDIGIVSYLCHEQHILDITGLTDRHIAKSPGAFLAKEYDLEYLFGKEPDFLILTFACLGNPDEPLPENTPLRPWTSTEGKIWLHPEFRRWYPNLREPTMPVEDWKERVALQFGAERVFQHAHPGVYYLLMVYRRQGSPAPLPVSSS